MKYVFHFRGSYAGKYVKGLLLERGHSEIQTGEEYLMWVEVQHIQGEKLVGKILKAKRLDECWDRS